MRRLGMIVNADDFGLSESVNRAIVESFRRGWLTRTTLMVNMPFADQAVQLARENGFEDRVGLHLNLIEGLPLTDSIKRVPLFCDESGRFNNRLGRQPLFWRRIAADYRAALRAEIRAQVKKFLAYGLPLLHCDSHQHSHWKIPILSELLPILREYGFKSVRRTHNLTNLDFSWRSPSIRYRLFSFVQSAKMRYAGFETTAYMGDYEQWCRYGDKIPVERSFELMLHPAYDAVGQLVNLYCSHDDLMETVGEKIGRAGEMEMS